MATIPVINKRFGQYGANALAQSYSDMPLDLYGSLLGGNNSLSSISTDNSTLGLLAAAARSDFSASIASSDFGGVDPSKVIDVSSVGGATTSPEVSGTAGSSTSPDVTGAAGSSTSPDVPGSTSSSISPDFPDTPDPNGVTTPDDSVDSNGYSLGYRDPSKRPDLFGGGAPSTTPDTGGGSTSPDVTGSTTQASTSGGSGSSSSTSGRSSTASEFASGLSKSGVANEAASLLSSPDEPITGSGMLGTARGGGIYPAANGGGSSSISSPSSTTDGAASKLQSMFDSMQAPTSDALAADSTAIPTSAWDGLGGDANSGHAMFETLPQNSVVDWSADTNVISAQLFPGY